MIQQGKRKAAERNSLERVPACIPQFIDENPSILAVHGESGRTGSLLREEGKWRMFNLHPPSTNPDYLSRQGKADGLAAWADHFYRESLEYGKRMGAKWDPFWLSCFAPFAAAISGSVDSSSLVLDLGCGGGQTTFLIGGRGHRVVGLDLSWGALSHPKPPAPPAVRFSQGSALSLPFSSAVFDAVGSYATFEHLPNIEQALEECIRVLKPGGALVLFGPNMLSPFRSLKLCLRNLIHRRPHPDGQFQFLGWTIRESWKRRKSGTAHFLYRSPVAEGFKFLGSDFDAICLVNPRDLARFLEQRGFEILSATQGGSLVGRLVARFWPWDAPGLALIARKKENK